MDNNLRTGRTSVVREGSNQPDVVTTAKIHLVEVVKKRKYSDEYSIVKNTSVCLQDVLVAPFDSV